MSCAGSPPAGGGGGGGVRSRYVIGLQIRTGHLIRAQHEEQLARVRSQMDAALAAAEDEHRAAIEALEERHALNLAHAMADAEAARQIMRRDQEAFANELRLQLHALDLLRMILLLVQEADDLTEDHAEDVAAQE
jgi:hypothetical protein